MEERQDDAMERTLRQLEEELQSLEFVAVKYSGTRRLELPNNLGWIEYRPLSGFEIDRFEEKRIKSKWRQLSVSSRELAGEVELISDWVSAFRFLFATAIIDFELRVAPDKVVKYSDFKRPEEVVEFFSDLHYKLQRYIAFKILKDSGWQPPGIGV